MAAEQPLHYRRVPEHNAYEQEPSLRRPYQQPPANYSSYSRAIPVNHQSYHHSNGQLAPSQPPPYETVVAPQRQVNYLSSQLQQTSLQPPDLQATAHDRQYLIPPGQRQAASSNTNLSASSSAESQPEALSLPFVVPQLSKPWNGANNSPFVRAYTAELQAHGISKEDFVTFIDGLNEAFVAHPIFQGLNVASMIMGQFYGVHPVQWAGMGLGVAAGLGNAATSYVRTRAYVKATNAELFHPAGLHFRLLPTKKMLESIEHPNETIELPALESFAETSPYGTQAPPNAEAGGQGAISSDLNRQAATDETLARRMRALEGYVLPLDYDVPAEVSPDNLLRKMGAAQARRLNRKQEKKLEKKRSKREEKYNEACQEADKKHREGSKDVAKIEKKLASEEAKLQRSMAGKSAEKQAKALDKFREEEAKLKQELRKEEAKRDKEVAKEMKKADKERGKADKKETKTANGIRWVVITTWEGEEDDEGAEPASVDEEEEVSMGSKRS